jgi:hypothetical protein
MSAIPLPDAGSLPVRRTTATRVALALAAILCAGAALLAALHGEPQRPGILPAAADNVVVLDLSASVSTDTYARIAATLDAVARSPGRAGLVVFSSTAYEALPPGTPARELGSLTRFFRATRAGAGYAPAFPPNPWTDAFSAGTSISAGLQRAADAARGLARPTVVLVSDLDDDPQDWARLQPVAAAYKRLGLPLRIVSLNASPGDVARIRRLFGAVPVERARLRAQPAHGSTAFPLRLALAAVGVALALAALELWAPPLERE